MRLTFAALAVAVGLAGFAAGAQAAPFSASSPVGASIPGVEQAQMMGERRMMRRRMMRREMRQDRRMMRRMDRRRMMRRM